MRAEASRLESNLIRAWYSLRFPAVRLPTEPRWTARCRSEYRLSSDGLASGTDATAMAWTSGAARAASLGQQTGILTCVAWPDAGIGQ